MATLASRLKCGARARDLHAVAALFWLASSTRVALALVHREVFGAEATLAVLCVATVPWGLAARRAVGGNRVFDSANARSR